ncbi:mitochondrial ubiquitin ligase activator of NFKB 1 [Thalassophryne amazonica]|uniref:mitochondrial ubiquitin ligase activator of NFKB 1 n=1 Tax=Thalassophryne amazonica TaxID=390379 RepID=UPI0014725C4C|nr:mitochondrial ubiquitin ligase activator of NFKB 1 [Thalassophryne amazonica]XP_034029337.1 mitochondrial ubiquitin ligase activator of NFKB 1 [Thalassophryne amazonica]XP_034029338.1 mitochondrial ubiquitin ligase activator of NFKB 1 [Thalassophryne amazonica]
MDTSGKPSTVQIVVLATSTALTAAFYYMYRSRAATVIKLKEAKKVPIDQDLQNFLSETPGKCVPYAVIEGVVKSVKEHLSSQFVDNCKGVIDRLTLKEKKMVWNRTTHLWNDTEKVIHQRTNSVPFALGSHDEDVITTVRVVRPLEAEELDLETVYEHFHPTAQSLSKAIGHFISGERPKGIHEAEEMLRLDDSLTGVGELVLDNNVIKLQPPKQGFSFFLSRVDYESLLRKQEKSVRLWKILTIIFGVAACSTVLFVLWRQYVEHRKRKEQRSMFEEFREQQRHRMRELNMEEDTVAPNVCSVCLGGERSCVFLSCGHVCTCTQCYEALPQPKKCPICRAVIDRMVPLYNS